MSNVSSFFLPGFEGYILYSLFDSGDVEMLIAPLLSHCCLLT